LKIPLLLVEYLYKNRKMSLPGLGIFTLDKSVVLPAENDRDLLSMPNAVQFQNANIAAADKELISFICENTGKIKPLAISDLDSYLNLGTEMLNIGKPFHLEGIGTITKNKSGKFDFVPGEYKVIKENTANPDQTRKKLYQSDKKNNVNPAAGQNRNFIRLVIVVLALALVGIGGWFMYKKNKSATPETDSNAGSAVQQQVPKAPDSLAVVTAKNDSLKNLTKDTTHPLTNAGQSATNYKFVILATEDKPHALRRYRQLLGFDLKAHLYQKDSTFFKVYFQFPALAKDTIQIKDSLRRQYAHTVTIEQ
jgi:hypothetical protein